MYDDDDLTPETDYKDTIETVQNYLCNYTKPCALDPNEEGASNSFAGALAYASNVFVNRLILGGAYSTNQDDKMVILEHLKAIMHVIEKYQK